jgi:hypothetical protein
MELSRTDQPFLAGSVRTEAAAMEARVLREPAIGRSDEFSRELAAATSCVSSTSVFLRGQHAIYSCRTQRVF